MLSLLVAAVITPLGGARYKKKARAAGDPGARQFRGGGTVITTPGTFDPIKQGAYNPPAPIPRGRRCMATTLTSSIRSR